MKIKTTVMKGLLTDLYLLTSFENRCTNTITE